MLYNITIVIGIIDEDNSSILLGTVQCVCATYECSVQVKHDNCYGLIDEHNSSTFVVLVEHNNCQGLY